MDLFTFRALSQRALVDLAMWSPSFPLLIPVVRTNISDYKVIIYYQWFFLSASLAGSRANVPPSLYYVPKNPFLAIDFIKSLATGVQIRSYLQRWYQDPPLLWLTTLLVASLCWRQHQSNQHYSLRLNFSHGIAIICSWNSAEISSTGLFILI